MKNNELGYYDMLLAELIASDNYAIVSFDSPEDRDEPQNIRLKIFSGVGMMEETLILTAIVGLGSMLPKGMAKKLFSKKGCEMLSQTNQPITKQTNQ